MVCFLKMSLFKTNSVKFVHLGKTICLLNKEYTIGRKNCTIELSDDLSVSRQHLKLCIDYSPLIQVYNVAAIKLSDI